MNDLEQAIHRFHNAWIDQHVPFPFSKETTLDESNLQVKGAMGIINSYFALKSVGISKTNLIISDRERRTLAIALTVLKNAGKITISQEDAIISQLCT